MMVVQPMVTFFMGQSRYAIQSLAVLPIIYGLTFIFRAIGLSYLEVVIALLGDRREHFGQIRNVGALVALGSAAALVGIAFTPLAFIWGSSQRSVQLRPVYMANKSSINSDLRGWRTPSVSGEELQTPGVRPTGDGGIARGLPVPRG